MVTISQLLIFKKRERKCKKNNVTMIIALCLVLGMMTPVYAQSNFAVINSKDPATVYLDHTRITKYVKSGIVDGWVKKVITEQDKALRKKNMKKNKKASKKEKAQQKAETEIYNKTSYQWLHLQFDPSNFRYKILESYSYGKESQLLSGGTNSMDWLTIPADSIEEKTLKNMNEYVQNHIDQVIMR